MKLIDKIIKILINLKYKKEPFMVWSWGIDDIHEINIVSAEYYGDHYRYGTSEQYYDDYKERFKAEYKQLIIRFDELDNYMHKNKISIKEIRPLCEQVNAMAAYKKCLEQRAKILKIKLERGQVNGY